MFDRMLSVLVALSLALLVWLYTRCRDQEILDNVPIPVRVSLPPSQADQYELELTGPTQVMVSFSGPPLRIRALRGILQRNELHIDYTLIVPDERLHESRYSDTIHLDGGEVQRALGVTPILIEGHNRVPITVHHLVERHLAVRLDAAQDEPVGTVILEPASVLVRGPQETLDRACSIATVPVSLPARSSGKVAATTRVALVQELEGRPVRRYPGKDQCDGAGASPQEIRADRCTDRVPLSAQLSTPAPVHRRAGQPDHADSEGAGSGRAAARVGLRGFDQGRLGAGHNHDTVQVQLPRDFSLVPDAPSVEFDLVPLESVPRGVGPIPGP